MNKPTNNKKNKRPKSSRSVPKGPIDPTNLNDMISQVHNLLKNDPEMVKKVSKCVNGIFENKELMESLVKQVSTVSTTPEEPENEEEGFQILERSLSHEQAEASSK
jgi:hypothetical protein